MYSRAALDQKIEEVNWMLGASIPQSSTSNASAIGQDTESQVASGVCNYNLYHASNKCLC